MGRILAIDYGMKRTGIAVTDPFRIIASALDTIPTNTLLKYLVQYMKTEEVDIIAVGDPMIPEKKSDLDKNIKMLAAQLKSRFPQIKIVMVDERFTSKIALRSMVESGMKKGDRRDKAKVDRISATIILQSYLDHLRIQKP
jgi:putative Holliday junction resolvase